MQLDIRTGHAQTVDKVLNWLQTDGSLDDITVCDVRPRPLAAPASRRARTASAHALPPAFVADAPSRARRAAAPAASPSRWRSRAPP